MSELPTSTMSKKQEIVEALRFWLSESLTTIFSGFYRNQKTLQETTQKSIQEIEDNEVVFEEENIEAKKNSTTKKTTTTQEKFFDAKSFSKYLQQKKNVPSEDTIYKLSCLLKSAIQQSGEEPIRVDYLDGEIVLSLWKDSLQFAFKRIAQGGWDKYMETLTCNSFYESFTRLLNSFITTQYHMVKNKTKIKEKHSSSSNPKRERSKSIHKRKE